MDGTCARVSVYVCMRAAHSVGIAARSVPSMRVCVCVCVRTVGSNWYTSERCVIDFYECVKNVCSDKNPPLNALKRDRDAFNVVIHQYISVFIYLDAARTVGSDILMSRCAIYCIYTRRRRLLLLLHSFIRFVRSFGCLFRLPELRTTDEITQAKHHQICWQCTPSEMVKCTNGNFLCNFSNSVVHSFVCLLVIVFSSISS